MSWSSCSSLEAPTIGAVTPGCRRTQASATWIGSTPFAAPPRARDRRRRSRRRCNTGRGRSRSCCSRRVASLRPRLPVAGEEAARQRAPRDHADALLAAERHHLALFLAIDQVVVVLHRDEPRPAVLLAAWTASSRTARRTCSTRRCSAPCPPSRRRAAPRASPRSACRDRSGGSGRGRRSPCRAAAARRRSRRQMCLRDSPRSFGVFRRPDRRPWSRPRPRRACANSFSARPTTSSLTPSEYMSAVSKKLMPARAPA